MYWKVTCKAKVMIVLCLYMCVCDKSVCKDGRGRGGGDVVVFRPATVFVHMQMRKAGNKNVFLLLFPSTNTHTLTQCKLHSSSLDAILPRLTPIDSFVIDKTLGLSPMIPTFPTTNARLVVPVVTEKLTEFRHKWMRLSTSCKTTLTR